MPTKPRQYHKGFWYHVYARGLQEVPLFASANERKWFLQKTDEVFTRCRIKLGALSLMGTHYHMLLKMGPVSLDKALRSIHMLYAKYVNGIRHRGGPLFRTRPGVDIVLDDLYLKQLVPYIHLNAVKAALVQDAQQYKWHTDALYRCGRWHYPLECWEFPPCFAGKDRVRVYRELMGDEVKLPPGGKGYIGEKSDWSRIQRRKKERKGRFCDRRARRPIEEIAVEKARKGKIKLKKLKEKGRTRHEAGIRQEAMFEMYTEGYGPTEIGEYFNRSKGTVMHAVYAIRQRNQ